MRMPRTSIQHLFCSSDMEVARNVNPLLQAVIVEGVGEGFLEVASLLLFI